MFAETPFVVAHRGGAGLAPENTLAAFREGVRHGARHIETDVRRSADGVLFLMHDERVDRTTNGSGMVGDLSWRDIEQLDAGSHFGPRFAGEKVPTLESALALAGELGVTLHLEVKYGTKYPGIERQVADAIIQADARERVIVISFDHDWLAAFNRLAPDIPVGPLWFRPGRNPNILMTATVSVHWRWLLLRPGFVRETQEQGHRVLAWTVNRSFLMRVLLWLGVDGIVTDRPDLWARVRSA